MNWKTLVNKRRILSKAVYSQLQQFGIVGCLKSHVCMEAQIRHNVAGIFPGLNKRMTSPRK
jgi:hypothetical protein